MNDGLLGWPRNLPPSFLGWPAGLRTVRPYFRQQGYYPTQSSTSAVWTPDMTPVKGTLLVAFISWSNYLASRTSTPPSGWTRLEYVVSGNANFAVYTKRADYDEPSSYSWSITGGSADGVAGVFFEVENVDTNADYYTVLSGTGFTAGGLGARDNSLALPAWKYEYATTPQDVTGYTLLRNTGLTYHMIMSMMKNDSVKAGEAISATQATQGTGSTVWITLLLHPKRARL